MDFFTNTLYFIELKKRTPPVNPPKKVELPPRSLTKREEDYLQHFTQFCKHIDDPKEYGIDTNPGSEEKKFSITAAEPSSHVFEDISRN